MQDLFFGIEPEKIQSLADRTLKEVVELRRQIHRNPELGMEEFETAARVREYLSDLGVRVKTGVGGTGVVGLLRGAQAGRTVALRADMDALPIEEETGASYASQNPGKM
ncbi:MAG: amidohydrolase, partial [Desulfovermiculus sp.]